MSRRVKIHLDLTVAQARALSRALDAAIQSYEGGDDPEITVFERLQAKVGPVVRDAIAAVVEPCPNCQATYHDRCCARCGRETRRSAAYCTAACEGAQHAEDLISAVHEAAHTSTAELA